MDLRGDKKLPETHISDLSRLKSRLVILYIIAAAGFIAGGLVYRNKYRAALERNAEDLLQSTENFKLDQFAYWQRDKIADIKALINSPLYTSYLKRFAADTSDHSLVPLIKDRLSFYVANYGYISAAITDSKGHIFVTAGEEFKTVTPESVQQITRVKAGGQPILGEFNAAPGEKHITLAAQATKNSAGKELFLLVRISPERYLYPLVEKWQTKSRTGETLIVRREGDEVVFLSRRRFNPARPRLKISAATASMPSVMGLNGIKGVIRGRDYRGVEVLAFISPVPDTSWVMVTKMDWDEVMADSGKVSALLILLTLALLTAAGGVVFVIFRLQADEYLREYTTLDRQASKLRINYDFLAETANDGMLVVATDTLRIQESNKRCREMYGYTSKELSGLAITSLIPESDLKSQKNRLEYSRSHAGAVLEAVHRRKNGELFPVELSSAFVSIEGINYIFTIIRDISERKKNEDALRESELRFRTLFEYSPFPAMLHSRSGEVLRINQAWEKMTGYAHSEIPTIAAWTKKAYGEKQTAVAKGIGRLYDLDDRKDEGEFLIRTKDGSERVWHFASAPMGLINGDRTVLSLAVDVTDGKLAEAKLEKLNRDLIDNKQEMENFLYITTHDLRSPLVNIQGFSQNLERYIKELGEALSPVALRPETKAELDKLLADRIPGALKFVLNSSHKMDALITALLKVSRIGRVEMKPETVDMNELLKRILDSLRYQLEDSGGKVTVAGLPPCQADPGTVSQLFSNLLDNTIKYRHQERALAVKVTGEVKEGMALYKVADNGAGIPEPELGRIWNVFYQPDRAPGRKGEGIGLPMVRRITEKNGGKIRVESKEGEGSVFYVELPAAQGRGT
jgi:PAS domain S-box-containing protein